MSSDPYETRNARKIDHMEKSANQIGLKITPKKTKLTTNKINADHKIQENVY